MFDSHDQRRLPLRAVLRRRRYQLNLSQAEIAEALRVTPECIGQWECGRRRMVLDKLPRIAAVLKMDAKEVCEAALAEFHPNFHTVLFRPEEGRAVTP